MKQLNGNCRYGKMTIYPPDYKSGRKSLLKKEWYIKYRFYDDNLKKSKQVVIKGGVNTLEDVDQRKEEIEDIKKKEIDALENRGWNPIFGHSKIPYLDPENKVLNKFTPLIPALKEALKLLQVIPDTIEKEYKPILNAIEAACKALGLDDTGVFDITLKNLYQIANEAATKTVKGEKTTEFSGQKFNRIKKVLRRLYSELLLLEVVPANLPMSMPRKKEDAKKKKLPYTANEMELINMKLKEESPELWLYVRIFFHSGARSTEMLRVKRKDVDFDRQIITYLVLKGKKYEYKDRPLLNIAVELWQKACQGATPDQYIFGEGLRPSDQPMTKNALKLRYSRFCKKHKLPNTMYIFKHMHTTEMIKQIGITKTAGMNAESERMVREHYDLEHEKTKHKEMIGVDVPFVEIKKPA